MDVDVRRTMSFQSNKKYLFDRTTETLGLLFDMHWPYRQFTTARNVRRSPFHDRLVSAGACMTEAAGFERPGFFAPAGMKPEIEYSYGRQNWFDACANECKNTAENVTLFDHSCFVKFAVDGPDACKVLNHVCANDVDVPLGKIVYTQWLNENGGIEADVTVTRLAETSYLVVTISTSQRRDFAWLRRHVPADAKVFIRDMSSGLPMLALMGPKSRALLQAVSPADFSNEAFPFGTSKEIDLGYARVRASRVTFVGELGWEIYMPAEFAAHVFDRLTEAGEPFGLRHGGYFALNSLRMEKGYRHWGHDIGEEDTPLQAGLSFAVALTNLAVLLAAMLSSSRRNWVYQTKGSSNSHLQKPMLRYFITRNRSGVATKLSVQLLPAPMATELVLRSEWGMLKMMVVSMMLIFLHCHWKSKLLGNATQFVPS